MVNSLIIVISQKHFYETVMRDGVFEHIHIIITHTVRDIEIYVNYFVCSYNYFAPRDQ